MEQELGNVDEHLPMPDLASQSPPLPATSRNNDSIIEELLNVKYDNGEEAGVEIDIATTIRNAILIPNNLNVSDDCMRLLCNAREQECSTALDKTIKCDIQDVSSQSEVISDQDYRCTFLKKEHIKAEPLSPDCSSLRSENNDNAVFHAIGSTGCDAGSLQTRTEDSLTFNGRIPVQPKTEYVVIQIEPEEPTITDTGCPQEATKSAAASESFEYTNERSPDLFEDIEVKGEVEDIIGTPEKPDLDVVTKSEPNEWLTERDQYLNKQLQAALSGVIPPPALTNVAITLDVILAKYKQHNGQMLEEKSAPKQTLLRCAHSSDQVETETWPDVKNVISHDVYYNLSSAIEQFEFLTVKYANRFIGADTASSFVMADLSSAKKRANRTKALQQNSPGRRLSHLARRRVVFSCANLMGSKEATAAGDTSKINQRQILLPVRKKGRTPNRKRKTPSSSAKKREAAATSAAAAKLALNSSRATTSKRCLFQSPNASKKEAEAPVRPKVTPEIANRVDRSRRALFASPKRDSDVLRKRKRSDCSDDEENRDQTKVQRTASPESSKRRIHFLRSQSFTAEHLSRQKSFASALPRTTSEIHIQSSQSATLTDADKKKLLFYVSQTLLRHISGRDPTFKGYATVMARVVKRLYLEQGNRSMYTAGEQINRLANRITAQVLSGQTEDEIYAEEKRKQQVVNPVKLTGYVCPDEYKLYIANRNNGGNAPPRTTTAANKPGSSLTTTAVQMLNSEQDKQADAACKATADNLPYNVLRENVDIELRQQQRTSSQKNLGFSGKDQKNVSPFSGGDGAKRKLLVGGGASRIGNSSGSIGKGLNMFKAKRQISFDT